MFAYKPRGEILAIHHLQDSEGKVMDKPQPWIVRLPALLPHPSSPPPYPYLVWSAVSDLKFPGLCVYTERPGNKTAVNGRRNLGRFGLGGGKSKKKQRPGDGAYRHYFFSQGSQRLATLIPRKDSNLKNHLVMTAKG